MVSENFKKIVFILAKLDRPLSKSEIHFLLKEYRIGLPLKKVRGVIDYYKLEYLKSMPIYHLPHEKVAYHLNRKGNKLAYDLFIKNNKRVKR